MRSLGIGIPARMLEQLGLGAEQIQFTPHLLPIPRGILSTIYVRLAARTEPEEIEACLRAFYATSPLVRIHATPNLPQIQHVVRTNYCDLGFELAKDKRRLVLVSCLDNLLKGAAGQAVQNMNVMCGWDEAEGLRVRYVVKLGGAPPLKTRPCCTRAARRSSS